MITYFIAAASLLTMGYFMGRAHGRILERFDMAVDETVKTTEETEDMVKRGKTAILYPSAN